MASGLPFLGETTNTADAVSLGYQQFSTGRPDAKRIFILMTDGNSFDAWNLVTQTAENLHKFRVKTFVLAFGDIIYQPEIKLYAGNGSVIRSNDIRRFQEDMVKLTCPSESDEQELKKAEAQDLASTSKKPLLKAVTLASIVKTTTESDTFWN